MTHRDHCTYSIRMPTTLRKQLDQLAEAQDRRPSQVVRRLIRIAYTEMERGNSQRDSLDQRSTKLGVLN